MKSADPVFSLEPLRNPAFRPPGFMEKLRAAFGVERPFQCVQIEISSLCRGACAYCPHTTQRKGWKSRHMRPETFTSLWPLLRQSSRAHLQGWGEPLLNPLFFEYQALAARAGCQTSTTTCGLVMDAGIATKLAASGMDLIAFSLAGTDEASNAVRQKVPFEKVCSAIRMLRAAIRDAALKPGLEIHIAYLLLADRMEAAAALPELMDQLDVDMAVVSTLDYLADPGQRNLAILPQDTEKIARAAEILEKASEKAESYGRLLHFALPRKQTGGCRENAGSCLYVDADGELSPCIYLNVPGDAPASARRVFGNTVREDPLKIWRREDYRAFRESLYGENPDPICAACPKRYEEG